jgi:prepilin-type processing-associated H-X9-DG protein
MMVYSNDYDGSYPVSGGKSSSTRTWSNGLGGELTWAKAEANINWSSVSKVTISSSWFLLIKYADVSAAQFVCQASNQKKFEFDSNHSDVKSSGIKDITEAWDFGPYTSLTDATNNPKKYVSYSMQNPFFAYSLSSSSAAGKAIAADRNVWLNDGGEYVAAVAAAAGTTTAPQLLKRGTGGTTTSVWESATAENKKGATSQAHQAEGQNVLFNDGHVSFEKTVVCGVQQDNIYTTWGKAAPTADEIQIGVAPTGTADILLSASTANNVRLSQGEDDSFLSL